jgi:hypothetical protein
MITLCPPRVIRAPNGGFRVYRAFVQDGRWDTLRYGVPPGVAMCRGCGCTNTWGCLPACHWVGREGRICSRCVARIER